MDKKNISLTKKITCILLLGVTIAVVVFCILFYLSNAFLNEYFATSSYIQNSTKKTIEKLQNHVTKNKIAATDTEELREWASDMHITYFTISRERMLLYDNSYNGEIPLEQTESEQLHYTWQYMQTVTFSDGDADVVLYGGDTVKYYIFADILVAVISAMICLGIFVFAVKKEVKYIKILSQEVDMISKGNMEHSFFVLGNDEVTDLANGLEQMRVSLIEKDLMTQNMKHEQDKLVVGMAHDLRTPLTSLMAYLEICKRQSSNEQLHAYLNRALEKSTQIRELSNQLFEFLLVNTDKNPELEIAENAELVLGDYFSELCALLENEDFTIDITMLQWKIVPIVVHSDYLGRIINNLISNITKYADKSCPVKLYSLYDEGKMGIALENLIASNNKSIDGTGIGVNNIRLMMEKMEGKCEVRVTADSYGIVLWFKVVK